MSNYRKVGNGLTPSALQLRTRILKNRRRAIWYGLLYLVGIIALAFVVVWAFPPIMLHQPIRILELPQFLFSFDKPTTDIACILYTIMLVVVLANVFRGCAKLKWLFKKTANDTQGFNRNVFAMLDLGKMFSASFIVIVVNYFFIQLIYQKMFDMPFIIMAAVCAFIHFYCGVGGAKVNFYDVDNGRVIEQSRVIGRFAAFIRNLIQIIAVFAMLSFILSYNVGCAEPFSTMINWLGGSGAAEAVKLSDVIRWVLVVVCLIPIIVLTSHALRIQEYNIDGVEGKGMLVLWDTFTLSAIAAFFALLLSIVVAVVPGILSESLKVTENVGYVFDMQNVLDGMFAGSAIYIWIVAGIALFVFIIELLMHNAPKYPEDRIEMEKINRNEEREIAVNDFSRTYADNVVESSMDRSQAEREDMEKRYVEYQAAMAAAQQKAYPNTQPGQPVAPYAGVYGQQPVAPNGQPMQTPPPSPYPVNPYPYPAPYTMPYAMPQQSLLPFMAGMSMMPMMANMSMMPTMMNGMNQSNVQGMDMLPSQLVREALAKNGSARELDKILFSDSIEPYNKSNRQRRKEAKAREKALRMMGLLGADDDVAKEASDADTAVDLPIKIDVECPCCHKKLHVTSVAMYNRCPSCKTVFQVRKSQTND